MNEYIVTVLIACTNGIIIYGGVRWRFGNGLMTQLFGVIMSSIIANGLVGFVLGKQGISVRTFGIALVVASTFVVLTIIVIQRTAINRLKQQADTILGVVNSLSAASQQAASSAEEQASAVAQVTSSIEEIHQMSRSTSDASQQVVKVADQAVSQGHQGLDSVRDVLRVMEKFAQATSFVQVVGEVAEQSNLLAVNAGIEAAKAGDFGRGFSVVASEVRNLAEQSKEAAKQIREAINQTKTGQNALANTETVITGLGTVLKEASDRARQISGAAVQQAAGIKQISDAMGNLSQGGKDTAATSQQIKQAAGELSMVSRKLAELIHGQSGMVKFQERRA